MNETDWQGGGDIQGMLAELGDRISDRRLRLFAVTCVRRVLVQVTSPRSRRALDVAERFAEDRASDAERDEAEQEALAAAYDDSYFQLPALRAVVYTLAWDIRTGRPRPGPVAEGADPVEVEDPPGVEGGFRGTLNALVELARLQAREGAAFPDEDIALSREAVAQEEAAQAAILREIVGNPYRPVVLAPLWLYWNERCVPNMARVILDERRWPDLPILADALEEAGCDNRAILDHLRSDGPHCPGCWALDSLLKKA